MTTVRRRRATDRRPKRCDDPRRVTFTRRAGGRSGYRSRYNAAIESFNGRSREECLNVHWFASVDDARQKIDAFRWGTTMRTILTALSRASALENTVSERWQPPRAHRRSGPRNQGPSLHSRWSAETRGCVWSPDLRATPLALTRGLARRRHLQIE